MEEGMNAGTRRSQDGFLQRKPKKMFLCIPWLHKICGQLCRIFIHGLQKDVVSLHNHSLPLKTMLNFLDLPDDAIVEILSRLGDVEAFQYQHLCKRVCTIMDTDPYFVTIRLRLNRAKPLIVFQNKSLCSITREANHCSYHVHLHFNEGANRGVEARIEFSLPYVPNNMHAPSLIGSYNGFLLFKHFYQDGFLIYNPYTQEQVLVHAPNYLPSGLYLHTRTNEYRILYMSRSVENNVCRFFVYEFRMKLLREVSSCSEAPCTCRSPVNVNGTLYWMASIPSSSRFGRCVDQNPPPCSRSILAFNIENERFVGIPHPQEECCLPRELLEMKGELCLGEISTRSSGILLWILKDYTNPVWEKVYLIGMKTNYYRDIHRGHIYCFCKSKMMSYYSNCIGHYTITTQHRMCSTKSKALES